MLPAGVEWRPSLQLSEKFTAVGFPGESVPDPFATGRKSLFDARLPLAQTSRLVAQALIVRAMFRLGRGEREAVWGDLIACHRLVRHIGNGATLIEGLVGCALDMVTFHADIVFLDNM